MIKANELRVGNKVSHEGRQLTIAQIREFEALFVETAASIEYEDLDPIELSPEILKACGFTKSVLMDHYGQQQMWQLGRLVLQYGTEDVSFFDGRKLPDFPQGLHQSQNLYFALTGTELPIDQNIFRKAGAIT